MSADVYQIDYQNQLTAFGGISYYNSISGTTGQTNIAFYRNVDSRIRGVEFEVAAEPIDRLSLAANLSYSKIESKGTPVPCNDATRPINAVNRINYCPSPVGQTLNQQAPFQASVNGSYTLPLGSFDSYFRFNVAYQGENPNFGNFNSGGTFKSTPDYAVVDLFAGLTGNRGGWDVGVFAKNVFDKRVELSRTALLGNIYAPFTPAGSGYASVTSNVPREIGVTLRYAFGSR